MLFLRRVHMKLIVIGFNAHPKQIELNAHRMHLDRIHMAQQVTKFEVNCGQRGCHK